MLRAFLLRNAFFISANSVWYLWHIEVFSKKKTLFNLIHQPIFKNLLYESATTTTIRTAKKYMEPLFSGMEKMGPENYKRNASYHDKNLLRY